MAKALKGEMASCPRSISIHPNLSNGWCARPPNGKGVAGYKLGLTSVLRFGLTESVRRLRDLTDLPIVYDHQKAGPEMPDMAVRYTALCKEAAVDGLILFPVAGPRQWDGVLSARRSAPA